MAIGVMDVPDTGALVSFMGPQVQVLWATVAVELLVRGARIALDRIGWSPGKVGLHGSILHALLNTVTICAPGDMC